MRAQATAAVVVGALVVSAATPAGAQAVITNGTGVALGVNTLGHLNTRDPAGLIVPVNTGGAVGVSFFTDYGSGTPDWRDATAPGCLCEGFGFSADGATGWANQASGISNMTSISFASTATTATAVARLTSLPGVTIAHHYQPSVSPSLYEAIVTIENTTGANVTDVRYRRVMDWDVPPTEFSEFVTLQGVGLGDLTDSCDDGFENGDPLTACSGLLFTNVNAVDSGPADHGASFTFSFGDLAAGATKTFTIFYGAAGTEAAALAALTAVGAQGIYSFGQPSSAGGASPGVPATFIFGFGGVGAPPIGGVPEPGTMLLLGGGLATVLLRRRRS